MIFGGKPTVARPRRRGPARLGRCRRGLRQTTSPEY